MLGFVICLPVYNSEKGLPYVLKNIDKIAEVYPETHVIVAYSEHTKDKSLDILKNHQSKYEIEIININHKSDVRVQRIAEARNLLFNRVKQLTIRASGILIYL